MCIAVTVCVIREFYNNILAAVSEVHSLAVFSRLMFQETVPLVSLVRCLLSPAI